MPRLCNFVSTCHQALVQDQGEGSGIAGKMSKSQCKFGKRKTISVEVDVVAESGHVWIEVKSHKCTDLESIEWLGVPGHAKVGSVTINLIGVYTAR